MVEELTRNLKIRYYRLRIFCIRKKIDKLNELLKQLESCRYKTTFEVK